MLTRRLRVSASSAGLSGGFGTRPGGTMTPARGARCNEPAQMPVSEARTGAESLPQGDGESRKRSAARRARHRWTRPRFASVDGSCASRRSAPSPFFFRGELNWEWSARERCGEGERMARTIKRKPSPTLASRGHTLPQAGEGKARTRHDGANDEATLEADRFEHRRVINNMFKFWSVCPNKGCKRTSRCMGEPRACFNRWWGPVVPEPLKAHFRFFVLAWKEGVSKQEALRQAQAKLEQHAEQIARMEAEQVRMLAEQE